MLLCDMLDGLSGCVTNWCSLKYVNRYAWDRIVVRRRRNNRAIAHIFIAPYSLHIDLCQNSGHTSRHVALPQAHHTLTFHINIRQYRQKQRLCIIFLYLHTYILHSYSQIRIQTTPLIRRLPCPSPTQTYVTRALPLPVPRPRRRQCQLHLLE